MKATIKIVEKCWKAFKNCLRVKRGEQLQYFLKSKPSVGFRERAEFWRKRMEANCFTVVANGSAICWAKITPYGRKQNKIKHNEEGKNPHRSTAKKPQIQRENEQTADNEIANEEPRNGCDECAIYAHASQPIGLRALIRNGWESLKHECGWSQPSEAECDDLGLKKESLRMSWVRVLEYSPVFSLYP